jgi:Immunity protein 52
MKHAYEFETSFHHHGDLSVDVMLSELQRFVGPLEGLSSNLRDWLLAGDTKEEAFLYEVFKDGQPTAAARAVLEVNLKAQCDPKIITMWNGLERHEGASLRFMGRPEEHTSLVTLVGRPESFSSNWQAIAEVVKAGVVIWPPNYVTVESNGYYEKKVFKDRPGVGWMLYLPRALNIQQVPEARALVPVMTGEAGKNRKPTQIGTIIVSVTDEPFSDENPEHVKIAHAIEIRLVDQDLLPRFADL